MSSQKFTPVDVVDMTRERDWPASLGLLDWDKTSIVFTKRSLIEFLKYTGTTVDTNNTSISKLPRYAKFGKLEPLSSQDALVPAQTTETSASENSTENEETVTVEDQSTLDLDQQDVPQDFRPTRRVRANPGGKDSLADWWKEEDSTEFKPTRRVRQNPGGQDNIAGIL